MRRLQFYFEHSLIGYFCRRAKEKWFTPPPPIPPGQIDYHGVIIQLDCLPQGMQELLLSDRYEFAELKLLSGMLSPADQVLEIGGAMGFIGLFCRKVLKVKELVSVEPNPKTISYLRRNYELNGLTPSIVEAAIAPADGPVSFYVNDMFWIDSLVRPATETDTQSVTVPGLTFQSILQRTGMTFNTLIIDVEGAEQFLPLQAIPDRVKKIMIEIHPNTIGTRRAYSILETLIRAGYEVHGHAIDSWALIRK
jgi:FkbM family methyltransferase